MVVCKCKKATKLYCFVHKIAVCGECICFPEHQICVIRAYSEWVIDGEYDWPPKCCYCKSELEEGTDAGITRLGCLHTIHTSCLVSHLKSFPPHTAPAGYVCPIPECSTSVQSAFHNYYTSIYVALVHKKLMVEILFWMKWLDSGPLGLGLVVRLLRRMICGLGAPYGSESCRTQMSDVEKGRGAASTH